MKFAVNFLKLGIVASMFTMACNQVEIPADHRAITPQAEAVAPVQADTASKTIASKSPHASDRAVNPERLKRAGIADPRAEFRANRRAFHARELRAKNAAIQGALAARNQLPIGAQHGGSEAPKAAGEGGGCGQTAEQGGECGGGCGQHGR